MHVLSNHYRTAEPTIYLEKYLEMIEYMAENN